MSHIWNRAPFYKNPSDSGPVGNRRTKNTPKPTNPRWLRTFTIWQVFVFSVSAREKQNSEKESNSTVDGVKQAMPQNGSVTSPVLKCGLDILAVEPSGGGLSERAVCALRARPAGERDRKKRQGCPGAELRGGSRTWTNCPDGDSAHHRVHHSVAWAWKSTDARHVPKKPWRAVPMGR